MLLKTKEKNPIFAYTRCNPRNEIFFLSAQQKEEERKKTIGASERLSQGNAAKHVQRLEKDHLDFGF